MIVALPGVLSDLFYSKRKELALMGSKILPFRGYISLLFSRLHFRKAPNSVNASKRNHKYQIYHNDKQRRVLMAN